MNEWKMPPIRGPKKSVETFKQLWRKARRWQRERIRKAGKHKCVKVESGTMSRLTTGGKKLKTLKHPKVLVRFYECQICGKDMGIETIKR